MFQLITLFFVLLFVKMILPKMAKTLSYILCAILAILFVIQLSSVILTGEIANYRFYENFNLSDVLSVSDFFGTEGIILFIVFIIVTFLFNFGSEFLKKKLRSKPIIVTLLLIGIVILSTSGGIINNAYTTLQLKFSKSISITDALQGLDINEEEYTTPEKVKASAGKNIIVLSLESFEKAYLSDKLKHLTPNLRKLAEKHNFYAMHQTPAGGWTSASMYTVLTGIPAFFKAHGNSVFQNTYEHKVTTVGTVLEKAGYDLQYFIGKKEYSGINDMLTSMNFSVKSEKDFTTEYPVVPWGMHDKDLFAEFKKELLQSKKTKKPFAFFLSTISTHFPNGVPDRRIDSMLPPQRSRLELMVSATDHFVGDLIDFLDHEDLLSNTVFYIYPDHLLMGDKATVIADFDERDLFFLTNAQLPNKPTKEALYQIDISKAILQGAQIKHNATFLTDYIKGEDKIAFLNKNRKQLLQLNDASLQSPNGSEGISVILKEEEEGVFNLSNTEDITLLSQKLPLIGNCHRIVFDENWRVINHFNIPAEDLLTSPKKFTYYLDVFKSNGQLYGSLKEKHHLGITKSSENEIHFDTDDFEFLNGIKLSEEKQNIVSLESNSWYGKKPSRFAINGVAHNISRGITMLVFNSISPDKYEQKTFDTYGSPEDAQALVSLISNLQKDKVQFIMVAHDAASVGLKPHKKILKTLGFEKLSELPGRHAYISYSLDGETKEFFDKNTVEQTLIFPKEIKNTKKYLTNVPIPFVSHINRFIAHAGGELDKIKYTNAKEALDANYKLGFRLFELDIEKTKDGKFVATHDWKHWAKQTGYKGELPVSLNTFLKHKIYGKYTPMAMKEINAWFGNHPDATLITDKVNEPVAFAKGFVDKKRLMMELFTTEAVEEASQNNILAMVSGKPLSEIKGDPIAYFKKHQLKYVSISRQNIAAKKELLKQFRANNIKVYVYHVNFDPDKNEQYVLDNEIGIVYGMYADKWISDFQQQKDKQH